VGVAEGEERRVLAGDLVRDGVGSGRPSSSRSAYWFSDGTRPQPESRAKSEGTKLGTPRPLRSRGSKLSSPTSRT
jgi:hypothetical protein